MLLIGYGNPGRLDDGLGPALAARLEASPVEGLSVESDYQLVVEHAHDVARHDVAIFADAALTGEAPYSFRELGAPETADVGSHSVTPETVLYLARKMFNANTRGYLLGIRGYEFDGFGERISERAAGNLEAAFRFVRGMALARTGAPTPS